MDDIKRKSKQTFPRYLFVFYIHKTSFSDRLPSLLNHYFTWRDILERSRVVYS